MLPRLCQSLARSVQHRAAALLLMVENGVQQIPIVQNDTLVGMLSRGNVLNQRQNSTRTHAAEQVEQVSVRISEVDGAIAPGHGGRRNDELELQPS